MLMVYIIIDNIPTKYPHCDKQVTLKTFNWRIPKNIDASDYKKNKQNTFPLFFKSVNLVVK
jgi:hypothetical protein